MKTIDRVIFDLCEDVDYWKSRCLKAEEELQEVREKYIQQTADSINHGRAMMANFLKLALCSGKKELEEAFGDSEEGSKT